MRLVIFFLLYLSFAQPAYAYLDPGTGSYIFQIVIATALGGIVGIKSYWGKIKKVFGKDKTYEGETEEKVSAK